jgi:hypothetical protein
MSSMRLLLVAATLGAFALPAGADAAPPWSAPARLLPGGNAAPAPNDPAVQAPDERFGAGTGGIATWTVGNVAGRQPRAIAPVTAGSPPGQGRVVNSVLDGPLPYAQTRTLSLRRGTLPGGRTRLGYSYGSTGGEVGVLRALDDVLLAEAALAVAPNGQAIIAYVERARPGPDTRLLVAFRRRSASRFGAPRVIRGSGIQSSVAVGVNERGRIVVAYQQDDLRSPGGRRVEARLGGTAGGVHALQRIGTTLGRARIEAAVAPTSRTTVAWTTADAGEEQNEPTQVRAAVAPAGSLTFRHEQLIDRGPSGIAQGDGPLSLATDAHGGAVIAYTLNGPFIEGDERTAVRAALQDASARFGAPQELTADGIAGRVAVGADGAAAVPYVDGARFDAPSPLRVALRAPGQPAFASVEEVAADAAPHVPSAALEPDPARTTDVLYVTQTLERAQFAAFSRRG